METQSQQNEAEKMIVKQARHVCGPGTTSAEIRDFHMRTFNLLKMLLAWAMGMISQTPFTNREWSDPPLAAYAYGDSG